MTDAQVLADYERDLAPFGYLIGTCVHCGDEMLTPRTAIGVPDPHQLWTAAVLHAIGSPDRHRLLLESWRRNEQGRAS